MSDDRITVPSCGPASGATATTPIVMVTAYDEPGRGSCSAAGVDLILVGDSVANIVLGHDDTLHVTIEVWRTTCGGRAREARRRRPGRHAVDELPPLVADAVRNAATLIRAGRSREARGRAGPPPRSRRPSAREIPVMGHLGLTPQAVLAMGGFRVQGKTAAPPAAAARAGRPRLGGPVSTPS